MIDITSSTNKSLKEWRSILGSRGVKQQGRAIVSGAKVTREIQSLFPEIIESVIVPKKMPIQAAIFPDYIPHYCLINELFRELDIFGTGQPLVVVKLPEIKPFFESAINDTVILLIPFQHPDNVGAVIRSAAAFGLKSLVMLKEAATPFHPKALRAAGTQAFSVDYYEGPSINAISDFSYPIVGLSSDGVDIKDFKFPDKFAILPGLEGPGLPLSLKPEYTVAIPMEPHVESLNASVATSILLYEYYTR